MIILGDIPKVTPSSKVVGDLAQFTVAENLDASTILDQAETLAFPDSVISYLKGDIGVPLVDSQSRFVPKSSLDEDLKVLRDDLALTSQL
jgi:pyruvate carboxylase